jgi:hypothetical protein
MGGFLPVGAGVPINPSPADVINLSLGSPFACNTEAAGVSTALTAPPKEAARIAAV